MAPIDSLIMSQFKFLVSLALDRRHKKKREKHTRAETVTLTLTFEWNIFCHSNEIRVNWSRYVSQELFWCRKSSHTQAQTHIDYGEQTIATLRNRVEMSLCMCVCWFGIGIDWMAHSNSCHQLCREHPVLLTYFFNHANGSAERNISRMRSTKVQCARRELR